MLVIETKNLGKCYGKIEALKGVSLTVEQGEIYGLLGRNGAGKTTLVKVLLGIAWKSFGDARLLGEVSGTVAIRQRVGYLPEDHRFPDYHTGSSLLNFYGKIMGVPRTERRKRVAELLEVVGLKGRMFSKVRTYSKGMKQRLGLAQAILHRPDVIFLDEPTDGVDPVGRREIRAIMQRLKDEGKTIFLNSHLLGEVELICDRVGIMEKGVLIREGDIPTLTRIKGTYLLGLARGEALPEADVEALGYQVECSGEVWEIGLADGQTIDPVVQLITQRGLSLRHLVEKRQTLEDLFVQTVQALETGRPAREWQTA